MEAALSNRAREPELLEPRRKNHQECRPCTTALVESWRRIGGVNDRTKAGARVRRRDSGRRSEESTVEVLSLLDTSRHQALAGT